MIKARHALLITTTGTAGLILLWLARITGSSAVVGAFAPLPADAPLTMAALITSGLTSPVTVIAMAIGGGIIAIYEHQVKLWWLLAGLLAGSAVISQLLKQVFELPRPEHGIISLGTYGFPSTHATVATVAFLLISWLAYRHKPKESHWMVISAGAVAWATICLSRILLGVHSLSDVLAGIILAAVLVSVFLWLAPRWLKYFNISLKERSV
jgi:undecaprenyl-diphosphatase